LIASLTILEIAKALKAASHKLRRLLEKAMNWKPISTVLLFASIPAISLGCEQIDVPDAAMFRANLERTGEYADGGPRKLTELMWKNLP